MAAATSKRSGTSIASNPSESESNSNYYNWLKGQYLLFLLSDNLNYHHINKCIEEFYKRFIDWSNQGKMVEIGCQWANLKDGLLHVKDEDKNKKPDDKNKCTGECGKFLDFCISCCYDKCWFYTNNKDGGASFYSNRKLRYVLPCKIKQGGHNEEDVDRFRLKLAMIFMGHDITTKIDNPRKELDYLQYFNFIGNYCPVLKKDRLDIRPFGRIVLARNELCHDYTLEFATYKLTQLEKDLKELFSTVVFNRNKIKIHDFRKVIDAKYTNEQDENDEILKMGIKVFNYKMNAFTEKLESYLDDDIPNQCVKTLLDSNQVHEKCKSYLKTVNIWNKDDIEKRITLSDKGLVRTQDSNPQSIKTKIQNLKNQVSYCRQKHESITRFRYETNDLVCTYRAKNIEASKDHKSLVELHEVCDHICDTMGKLSEIFHMVDDNTNKTRFATFKDEAKRLKDLVNAITISTNNSESSLAINTLKADLGNENIRDKILGLVRGFFEDEIVAYSLDLVDFFAKAVGKQTVDLLEDEEVKMLKQYFDSSKAGKNSTARIPTFCQSTASGANANVCSPSTFPYIAYNEKTNETYEYKVDSENLIRDKENKPVYLLTKEEKDFLFAWFKDSNLHSQANATDQTQSCHIKTKNYFVYINRGGNKLYVSDSGAVFFGDTATAYRFRNEARTLYELHEKAVFREAVGMPPKNTTQPPASTSGTARNQQPQNNFRPFSDCPPTYYSQQSYDVYQPAAPVGQGSSSASYGNQQQLPAPLTLTAAPQHQITYRNSFYPATDWTDSQQRLWPGQASFARYNASHRGTSNAIGSYGPAPAPHWSGSDSCTYGAPGMSQPPIGPFMFDPRQSFQNYAYPQPPLQYHTQSGAASSNQTQSAQSQYTPVGQRQQQCYQEL